MINHCYGYKIELGRFDKYAEGPHSPLKQSTMTKHSGLRLGGHRPKSFTNIIFNFQDACVYNFMCNWKNMKIDRVKTFEWLENELCDNGDHVAISKMVKRLHAECNKV